MRGPNSTADILIKENVSFSPKKNPAAKEHKQCLMQMAFVEDEQQTSDVT